MEIVIAHTDALEELVFTLFLGLICVIVFALKF